MVSMLYSGKLYTFDTKFIECLIRFFDGLELALSMVTVNLKRRINRKGIFWSKLSNEAVVDLRSCNIFV